MAKTLRPAIAMIELIFAIVVMGIAMLALPLMVNTATKSSQVAFNQESIAIIASHANALMSYAWDEQNTISQVAQAGNLNVLIAPSSDNELDTNRTTLNGMRTLGAATASTPNLFGKFKDVVPGGTTAPERIEDDVDDFDGQTRTLEIALSGSQNSYEGDIMDTNISMYTNVSYANDQANYAACSTANGCAYSNPFSNATNNITNIKLITTQLTSTNVTDKKIILKSFVCNIGFAAPFVSAGVF